MTSSALPPSLATGWVLVDFHATWCGPCQMLAPVLDEVAVRYKGRMRVAKVDVDASPHVAQRFSVASMPTLVLCRDGQEVERHVGFQGLPQLTAWLDRQLAS